MIHALRSKVCQDRHVSTNSEIFYGVKKEHICRLTYMIAMSEGCVKGERWLISWIFLFEYATPGNVYNGCTACCI